MKTKRNLVIFTVLVLGLSWLGKWVDIQAQSPPGQGPGAMIWLGSPLLIALLLRGFAGDGWKDLGIKPNFKGNSLWYLISILVYPVGIILIIVIGQAIGAISFSGLSEEPLATMIQGIITMLIMQMIKNLFEEFAFRGYLAPKMYTLQMNTFVSHGLVGLIWGLWHLPYIRYITPYTTESLVPLVPRFVLGALAASIVYGEIRLKTNSVWPAWVMHTVGATVVSAFMLYGGMTFSTGMEWLFHPVFEGTLTIVFFIAVGIILHLLRGHKWRSPKHS